MKPESMSETCHPTFVLKTLKTCSTNLERLRILIQRIDEDLLLHLLNLKILGNLHGYYLFIFLLLLIISTILGMLKMLCMLVMVMTMMDIV
jgi:hypothetical protein